MPKINYNGIEFDSEEERLFYLYLEELKENGFVRDFTFHVETFNLFSGCSFYWKKETKNKPKEMETTLLQGHVYTPDYRVFWTEKAKGIFVGDINDCTINLKTVPFISNSDFGKELGSYIEVKPSFDMNNMQRLFSINQKWVFKDYNIFVQKVIPVGKSTCLFAKTFVPKEAMLTAKTKKPKTYKFKTRSLQEFLGELK